MLIDINKHFSHPKNQCVGSEHRLLGTTKIIVGSKQDLLKKEISLKNLNLLADKKIFNNEILVKVRSTGKLIKSKLKFDGKKAKLELFEDEYGIS